MDKKQVLVRFTDDTYQRLQDLSKKYGTSVAGLFAAWINERWLVEFSSLPSCGEDVSLPEEKVQVAKPLAKPVAPARPSGKRKRRR